MKRFKQLDDGNYLDRKTGLIWKEYSEKGSFTWAQAIKIENDDWRLPTSEELKGLLSKKKHNNTFTKLPSMTPYWYWSSSSDANDSHRAWIVLLGLGNEYALDKSNNCALRMVKR
jgi:hypothetical protein